ncbi:hypothetical protein [Thermococcus sp.]|uniref:hypothetical protein n=1 Tax=Thermococcus sp. TaxID=35749 RepID=UPI002608EE02|nr:hypothetical protein [Thermococcus sp.]
MDTLEWRLDKFERKYGIEILRVFVSKPLYYTTENKRFVRQILHEMLCAVYHSRGSGIKTLEIDNEGVLIVDRDQDVLGFWPLEMWDNMDITEIGGGI